METMTQVSTADWTKRAPEGNANRFGGRWRLTGVGISNVWRYGNLVLPTGSGRLLLRGRNGTGKTTALELVWPFLLDLKKSRMAAGKQRSASLQNSMREGTSDKKRVGYLWMTFAGPGEHIVQSYGVRLVYSEGSTPPVKVEPFTIPGEPLKDMPLTEPGTRGAITTAENFRTLVESVGGTVFNNDAEYVTSMANNMFGATREDLMVLADRIRNVRNPELLGDVTPEAAAKFLRDALPEVSPETIEETGQALSSTEETRAAFQRDIETAELLGEFAEAWSGYASEVVRRYADKANQARIELDQSTKKKERLDREFAAAEEEVNRTVAQLSRVDAEAADVESAIASIHMSPAYAAIGDLNSLREEAKAKRETAEARRGDLEGQVKGIKKRGDELRVELESLIDRVNSCVAKASGIDLEAGAAPPRISLIQRPYPILAVGNTVVDAGPRVEIESDPEVLNETAQRWRFLAIGHETLANQATLLLADHRNVVAPAQRESDAAIRREEEAQVRADSARQKLDQEERNTTAAVSAAATAVSAWALDNRDLTGTPDSDPLDSDTIGETVDFGASVLLDAAALWKEQVKDNAAQLIADLKSEAATARSAAEGKRAQARELRAEADELRSGRDIPPPRPSWAGPAGDHPFAGALQWKESTELQVRALLEDALASSGLLGAALSGDGQWSDRWSVSSDSPVAEHSLASYLEADPQHPLADSATAVVRRIAVADTVSAADSGWASVVGKDGSFRFGVIRAGAPSDADVREPSFIGAAQRRTASLAQAAVLDESADGLESEAGDLDSAATELLKGSAQIRSRADSFPDLRDLDRAERRRSLAAEQFSEYRAAAEEAAKIAAEARSSAMRLAEAWTAKARALNLPDSVVELDDAVKRESELAGSLRTAASELGDTNSALLLLRSRISGHDDDYLGVPGLVAQVNLDQRAAEESASRLAHLESEFGSEEKKTGDNLAALGERKTALKTELWQLGSRKDGAIEKRASLGTAVTTAEEKIARIAPETTAAVADLRGALSAHGVVDAVLDGAALEVGPALIEQALKATESATTRGRARLLQTYDSVRAQLRNWSVDRSDSHVEGLDTYRCTHDGITYTPTAASSRSTELADKAREQLGEAEESAMREFIVGQLPLAVNIAFTQMSDWVSGVNEKMKNTKASSGVGVEVKVSLRDDLSPPQRAVYELACKKSAATRTAEDDHRLAEALRSLLDQFADETDSDVDRVRKAVDIRQWVRVDYLIERPTAEKKQRWSSRVGLSNGERRLVVIAPMLAAVAALHDKFADTAPRVAALDEIPVDVDEFGIDGLARYIASLDLDLICTSHQWDGAPGAWDGIDAHDLETGPSGTVVAFRMLVRGADPVPGDPDYQL